VHLVSARPIDLGNNVLVTTISLTQFMHAFNPFQTMPRNRRCWRMQCMYKPNTV